VGFFIPPKDWPQPSKDFETRSALAASRALGLIDKDGQDTGVGLKLASFAKSIGVAAGDSSFRGGTGGSDFFAANQEAQVIGVVGNVGMVLTSMIYKTGTSGLGTSKDGADISNLAGAAKSDRFTLGSVSADEVSLALLLIAAGK
jgi:hypothetical protein